MVLPASIAADRSVHAWPYPVEPWKSTITTAYPAPRRPAGPAVVPGVAHVPCGPPWTMRRRDTSARGRSRTASARTRGPARRPSRRTRTGSASPTATPCIVAAFSRVQPSVSTVREDVQVRRARERVVAIEDGLAHDLHAETWPSLASGVTEPWRRRARTGPPPAVLGQTYSVRPSGDHSRASVLRSDGSVSRRRSSSGQSRTMTSACPPRPRTIDRR